MKILAIDTTTNFLSLGIYDNGRVCEYNLKTGHRLSQLLAPTVERTLSALDLSLADIDYFAAGCGPGSFTGIRLGLSFMKGLGFSLNKPLIAEVTLDVMAMNCPPTDRKIIPSIDAKRGLVYTCVYKYKSNKLIRLTPYLLITKEQFLEKIESPSVIFGDALNICQDDIVKKTGGAIFLDKDLWYPKAHNIITLARDRIGNKSKPVKSFKFAPVYLYPKECQINKLKEDCRKQVK
ncbi:MAG: tRNA (adenosine(37)-N6)-threonylcarbamoyltransferase complex dimerization subunit type 1 TsaB [Candidatus Omnitrophica bacterium]|jgi:tRNA threonylcarbamoyladenosine biosynthesis protein TsaB|nr:tRNA (adenosine(37)-N6)-threonylcarbamoyltransferase complex dimerization subunit type 1 TsaB [Candidatus Omnitrophota bacterium]MDD3987744.1 tRNA (adenosine(37)-N6)-threonylcarbamoyltransferase complex dimerization subunit type 1 TsaB [Candidatus Omnitrophota bacterium]MDD4982177.1 tRNA (adenosine(37)-N6)-threonylcarbamoyltransferase complex dimerization subunit type 1 TsaB [Candidatus Omnitrophota bacterium]MDD5664952.1 tRNA (adenosine(37)-N6)-threonylcarbamoyltransferase complex dimerizati